MSDKELDEESTLIQRVQPEGQHGDRYLTLLAVGGPDAGQWYIVPPQGGVIGRSPKAQIRLSDEAVSRRHAVIELGEGGSVWIRDLGSRNGVFIDRQQVDRHELRDGEQIQLTSQSVLRVRYLGARETLVLHEMQEAATTDALTGVANRRYLVTRLDQELAFSRRHKLALSVLMVDVDHFKDITEAGGHTAGDARLQRMAQVLEDNVRTEDIVARYGGDEFVVIARGYTAAACRAFGERLCKAVREAAIPATAQSRITVSIGIADFDPHGSAGGGPLAPMELLTRADAAVFAAKHAGRDRVALWHGPPSRAAQFEGDIRATVSAPIVEFLKK